MLQKYDEVACSLVARGLAIQHYSNNVGKLAIQVKASDGSVAYHLITPPPPPTASPLLLSMANGGRDSSGGGDGGGGASGSAGTSAAVIVVGGVSRPAPTAADRVKIRFPYTVDILELIDAYVTNESGRVLYLHADMCQSKS